MCAYKVRLVCFMKLWGSRKCRIKIGRLREAKKKKNRDWMCMNVDMCMVIVLTVNRKGKETRSG